MRVGATGFWLKFYLPWPLLASWILFYTAVFVKYVHFSILNVYTCVFEGELYEVLVDRDYISHFCQDFYQGCLWKATNLSAPTCKLSYTHTAADGSNCFV